MLILIYFFLEKIFNKNKKIIFKMYIFWKGVKGGAVELDGNLLVVVSEFASNWRTRDFDISY
jgi:hypothetical protein